MSARRLHLDYVAARWPAWPGWCVLAFGLALSALALGAGLAARDRAQLAQDRLEEIRRLAGQSAPAPKNPDEARRAEQEIKSVEQALRQLVFPWQSIFDAVERSAHADVALLGLQPDPVRGAVLISAEARSREAMLAYWRALTGDAGLKNVHIARYEMQEREPRQPIRFQIQAELEAAR